MDKYVKRSDSGEYRGQKFEPDTILLMGEELASKVILSGKGSPSTEDEYKEQVKAKKATDNAAGSGNDGNQSQTGDANVNPYEGKTLAELKEVDYKKLNRDPLAEYARACGLEIGEEVKKDIYKLIDTVDFEAKAE